MEKSQGKIFFHYPPSIINRERNQVFLREELSRLDNQILVSLLADSLLPFDHAFFPVMRIMAVGEFLRKNIVLIEVIQNQKADWYGFSEKTFRTWKINQFRRRK